MKKIIYIIYFLTVVSIVSCYGFIVESDLFSPDNAPSLIAVTVLVFPIIIPIFSFYFLKIKFNKVVEKRKTIYAILFLTINLFVSFFYIFLFLMSDAINGGW